MIHVIEDNQKAPTCPHCEKTIQTILSNRLSGGFGVRYIYFCPECQKVLGISHRKGFWMG